MKIGLIVSKLFAGNAAAVQTAGIVAGAVALNVGVFVTFKAVSEGPQAAEGVDGIVEIYEDAGDSQVGSEIGQSEVVVNDLVIEGDGSRDVVETTSEDDDESIRDSSRDQQDEVQHTEESIVVEAEPGGIIDKSILKTEVRIPEEQLIRSPKQPP